MEFKRLQDTVFSENFAIKVGQTDITFFVNVDDVPKICEIVLMGMVNAANVLKNKENPIAVVIDDNAGNVLLATKIYFEVAGDNEGSWKIDWVFDEKNLKDTTRYCVSEPRNYKYFIEEAAKERISFNVDRATWHAAVCFASTLIDWLDTNADPKDTAGIELEGYFKASVKVIDDEKFMTFSADEEINGKAKGDKFYQSN